MEDLIKLNNQTAGRDKIARLIQYLCKLLWYRFQRGDKSGVQALKNLEYQLSIFRKLLRFGRCADIFYASLLTFQHPDPTLRTFVTLSKISNALFLLTDHILWLGRADLCNVNTNKWNRLSNKYWLYSITMNLSRDFYEIMQIVQVEKARIVPKPGLRNINDVFKAAGRAVVCVCECPSVAVDTIKNCCDFFIPLSALGHVKLPPDVIGFLGVVSSIAGLIALIQPVAKLTPA